MRKIFFYLILIFVYISPFYAQVQKVKITFEIITPGIDDTATVYIAGNQPELGNWNPGEVKLERINKQLWKKTFEFPKGMELAYKFTKGSWGKEALNDDATIPQDKRLKVNNDTLITFTINNWRDNFNFKVPGQITGSVEYHKNFVMEGLKPRDIIVWLPPGYDKNVNERYPVLYMHDGQNIVDPRTSSMFVDWQVDETADSLIRNNIVEPVIIVGINNTDDRGDEYNNTPLGKLYMKLIVEKIKPFIDSNYRTKPDRLNTSTAGSSMGGLISFMLAWEYPEIFSKAACFSPAFKIADIDYVKEVLNYEGKKRNLLFYIDNGGVNLEAMLQPGVDEMTKVLREKCYKENVDFYVYIDKEAEHNEAAWAKRMWRPLKLFFGIE
ncbi:MAG: alpha/beta hydrolase-fold protein [Bacteroidota bacterium]